jgi:ribosome maturation factor RimP
VSHKDQIRPAVEGPLGALGLYVEDLAVTPAGKRRLVRIWIDRALDDTGPDTEVPTAPLSLDEVADATRAVSQALDDADAMGEQPYTLEVTSPGLDRPLTRPHHFRRNVGRLVTATLVEGPAVTGRVVRAGSEAVVLEVPATKKVPASTVELAYAAVTKAVVQVEFSRTASAWDGSDSDDADDGDSGEHGGGGATGTDNPDTEEH